VGLIEITILSLSAEINGYTPAIRPSDGFNVRHSTNVYYCNVNTPPLAVSWFVD